jgi:hypothetical protein
MERLGLYRDFPEVVPIGKFVVFLRRASRR